MRLFKNIKNNFNAMLVDSPVYVKFLELKKKLANGVLKALLGIFSVIGPVWNFFFVKKPNGDLERKPKVHIGTKS